MRKKVVKVQFIFEGEFLIEANSSLDVRQIVDEQIGLCMGGTIQTISDRVTNWVFPHHSKKKILSIKNKVYNS